MGFKNKEVVVTGGGGFIGSHLVNELVKQGAHVIVLDNEFNGNVDNLVEAIKTVRECKNGGSVVYRKVDICDPKIDLGKELLGDGKIDVDYVFHLAAVASVPRSVSDPLTSFENNVTGTLRVLLACKHIGVGRVIFASSSSVYGDNQDMPKIEEKTGKTLSPYALTKHIGEELMRQFYELYGLETVSVRYFNVFGPRQDPNSPYSAVIPLFIKKMLNKERPVIFGDGTQTRDFTYVKNVVDGTLLFATLPKEKVCGKSFNVACGNRVDLNTLVGCLNKELGTKLKPKYSNERKGDVKHSSADISKARALGFTPSVSFEQGISETVKYYKEENQKCQTQTNKKLP